MDSKLYQYKYSAFLILASAILLLSGLNKIDVNIMEARNFISAREMVQNKEYLLTTINNQPRYQKPPLPTWLTAVSGSIFGFDSLFALRLPVVIITILLVIIFYRISRLLNLDAVHSMNNGLILITSFYIFFSGRDNQWDMYSHSLMMVSICFMIKLFLEDANKVQHTLLSGLFMGLSILSKGPVSFYALFLPFLISYSVIYHIPFRRLGIYLVSLILLGFLIGLSWYVYVRLKDPLSFKAIATRETTNWINYEVKPFYYYWSFFLQSGLWATASFTALMYPYLKKRVSNLKAYRFSLLWTILALFFLSVIPEKKIRYLVPVLIPLALTTGSYIEYLFRNFNRDMGNKEKTTIYFSFGLFALIALLYPFVIVYFLKEHLKSYTILLLISTMLMYGCAYFIITGLKQKRFPKVFYAMIALFTVVVISITPMYKEVLYNPYYSSTQRALMMENQYGIKTYGLTEVAPEIVWDYGKAIPLIQNDSIQKGTPPDARFGLLVGVQDTASFMDHFPMYQFERVYQINLHYKKKKGRLTKNYYIASRKDTSYSNSIK
jgi:4-amino-4-deoxy-L-arabinose transferase-like glycosyltransferase